jgi:hypothetical protein
VHPCGASLSVTSLSIALQAGLPSKAARLEKVRCRPSPPCWGHNDHFHTRTVLARAASSRTLAIPCRRRSALLFRQSYGTRYSVLGAGPDSRKHTGAHGDRRRSLVDVTDIGNTTNDVAGSRVTSAPQVALYVKVRGARAQVTDAGQTLAYLRASSQHRAHDSGLGHCHRVGPWSPPSSGHLLTYALTVISVRGNQSCVFVRSDDSQLACDSTSLTGWWKPQKLQRPRRSPTTIKNPDHRGQHPRIPRRLMHTSRRSPHEKASIWALVECRFDLYRGIPVADCHGAAGPRDQRPTGLVAWSPLPGVTCPHLKNFSVSTHGQPLSGYRYKQGMRGRKWKAANMHWYWVCPSPCWAA